jgi:hypothetical protein
MAFIVFLERKAVWKFCAEPAVERPMIRAQVPRIVRVVMLKRFVFLNRITALLLFVAAKIIKVCYLCVMQ